MPDESSCAGSGVIPKYGTEVQAPRGALTRADCIICGHQRPLQPNGVIRKHPPRAAKR